MSTQWIIYTGGDPLTAIRHFAQRIWRRANLDGLLGPLEGNETVSKLRVFSDPAQLDQLDPFKPLMTLNTARLVPTLLRNRSAEKLGLVLRPCEMRALNEMARRSSLEVDHFLTICCDCLGTLPPDEFLWRMERKGSAAGLTKEAIQFARQGGILPYRYRPACQMCLSPAAAGAHLNVGLLGLPVKQVILVETRDEAIATWLELDVISDGPASPGILAQREHLLAKLAARHHYLRERITSELADDLPANVEELVAMLEMCGQCRACLEVCPICAAEKPLLEETGRYSRNDVARWLVSCAGCGMCEQACPKNLPLGAIFSRIREQLAAAADDLPAYLEPEGQLVM